MHDAIAVVNTDARKVAIC